MALIVAVHGIAQELKGEDTIGQSWRAAIRDGLRRASVAEESLPASDDIRIAFYGELFRESVQEAKPSKSSDENPWLASDVLDDPVAEELLSRLVTAADQQNGGATKSISIFRRTPGWVQDAVLGLLGIPFFASMSEHVLVGTLKQVSMYLTNPIIRKTARERVLKAIDSNTKVLIGHSLGSVVAYEALFDLSTKMPLFLTIGSPLGMPGIVFDKLLPTPKSGLGAWPNAAQRWTNVADPHDLVAL
jgi:hypothetical protein